VSILARYRSKLSGEASGAGLGRGCRAPGEAEEDDDTHLLQFLLGRGHRVHTVQARNEGRHMGYGALVPGAGTLSRDAWGFLGDSHVAPLAGQMGWPGGGLDAVVKAVVVIEEGGQRRGRDLKEDRCVELQVAAAIAYMAVDAREVTMLRRERRMDLVWVHCPGLRVSRGVTGDGVVRFGWEGESTSHCPTFVAILGERSNPKSSATKANRTSRVVGGLRRPTD
jgi:hypothetical protein